MQVFFTNVSPKTSAENISFAGKKNGKTVYLGKKMIIESFQLLSMQLWLDGIENSKIIGIPDSHQSHESRMWLDESPGNVRWLLRHSLALSEIGGAPNGKVLNSSSMALMSKKIENNYSDCEITPPNLAMRQTSLDICSKYGKLNVGTTYTGKMKCYYKAKTVDDACSAYKAFLKTKDYFNNKHTLK